MGMEVFFHGLVEHKNKDEMGKSVDVVQARFKILEHFNFSQNILGTMRVIPFFAGDVFPSFEG
jgi:hypothetical protein